MRKIFASASLLIFIFTFHVTGQPTGYYNGTEGKQGDELKAILNDIISGHVQYSYFYSKEIFKLSDRDPANPNNVIEIYTGKSHPNDDYGSGSDQLNREHVWAKSHGNFEGIMPMDGDVQNLKPIDASVNTDKSNLDFDYGGNPHPEATGCYWSDDNWEPRDQDKGDIARIIFYMDTRYEGENGELDLEAVDYLNTYPEAKHGKLSALLEWNMMDPPDDFERNRNNVIYSFQKNRNPFIDDPYFAELIWRGAVPSPVQIGNVAHAPETPVANQPITISANISSSQGAIASAVVHYGISWNNLNNTVNMVLNESTYTADIPGQGQGVTVYFKIEASDGMNTASTVPYNFYVPKIFTGTLTSIYDVQGQSSSTPFAGQTKSISGVVTGSFGKGYFLQDGYGAWNGIYVYDQGRNPSIGDSLIVTGKISEYYNKTEISQITDYYLISTNNELPEPVVLTTGTAGTEEYEGVLIRIFNAICTEANSNFGMWTVNDGSGDFLVHNTEVFEYLPVEGESYVVTGPLDYDFDEWKLHLRFETDVLGGIDIIAPTVTAVVPVTATVLRVEFSEDVEEASAEAIENYSINNGVIVAAANLHGIIKSHVYLDISQPEAGDYEIAIQNVKDLAGNVMEPIVMSFSESSVDELFNGSLVSIYPNPARDRLNINFGHSDDPVTVGIFDITGRMIFTQASEYQTDNMLIDLKGIQRGYYLIRLYNETDQFSSKVIIY